MLKLSSLYLQVKNIAEANFWLDRYACNILCVEYYLITI